MAYGILETEFEFVYADAVDYYDYYAMDSSLSSSKQF